jgi:hypothetical protein
MSQGPHLNDPELGEVEAALGSLSPARSRLDRDRTFYRAGMAASRRLVAARRLWPALAAGLSVVALGQTVRLAIRPPTEVVERIVFVSARAAGPVPAAVPEPEASPSRPDRDGGTGRTAYERLESQVLRYGLDGLPPPAPTPDILAHDDVPPSSGRWLRLEIESILNPGGPT